VQREGEIARADQGRAQDLFVIDSIVDSVIDLVIDSGACRLLRRFGGPADGDRL
jgi:hypothetical protein